MVLIVTLHALHDISVFMPGTNRDLNSSSLPNCDNWTWTHVAVVVGFWLLYFVLFMKILSCFISNLQRFYTFCSNSNIIFACIVASTRPEYQLLSQSSSLRVRPSLRGEGRETVLAVIKQDQLSKQHNQRGEGQNVINETAKRDNCANRVQQSCGHPNLKREHLHFRDPSASLRWNTECV